MIKNWGLQIYSFCKEISALEILGGCAVALFFAYFFYRSAWAIPFMMPVGAMFIWWTHRKKLQEKELCFLEQFKECILSVAASLRAGYAVENAFAESVGDMKMMFGERCEILEQLTILQKGLRNNETLESLLYTMAKQKNNKDILEFAEVFSIAKRSSGNVTEVILIYSSIIAQKLEETREIQTLLAAKRLEQRVMNVMPFLIVTYLEYSNPGYFDMMFHNWSGVLIMTGCLAGYLAAFAMAELIFVRAYS